MTTLTDEIQQFLNTERETLAAVKELAHQEITLTIGGLATLYMDTCVQVRLADGQEGLTTLATLVMDKHQCSREQAYLILMEVLRDNPPDFSWQLKQC